MYGDKNTRRDLRKTPTEMGCRYEIASNNVPPGNSAPSRVYKDIFERIVTSPLDRCVRSFFVDTRAYVTPRTDLGPPCPEAGPGYGPNASVTHRHPLVVSSRTTLRRQRGPDRRSARFRPARTENDSSERACSKTIVSKTSVIRRLTTFCRQGFRKTSPVYTEVLMVRVEADVYEP